ncbi:NAD(P)-dependent oxidoreductase [Cyclobacterium plantarum]|uniref:NAD(P)H-binding protein n=1 Tax=Cyclobacterium plantarum TaxID=2716263 RepID=A0ABX0HD47_9BACT|nr:NAD(P)H-binding protein [Cyclobacterium plantarum]NHE59245.1 NAD(P)H-binding protein [Cyclobacterium plantarum]
MSKQTTLVLGASGATGKHLVSQLLLLGQSVKVIVRPNAKIPDSWLINDKVSVLRTEISNLSEGELADHIEDCQGLASCLGHNLTWKGIYGAPRKLVSQSVQLLCRAVEKNKSKNPVKLVLMNTAGNQNRDLSEPVSFGEKCLIALIRLLLPPHTDNEAAADFLRIQIGQKHPFIEWVVVRPDTLIDREEVSDYTLHASPSRSALFNPGKTSRINVAHVMAKLIGEKGLWEEWKGQMPVIYNKEIK